MKRPAFLGSIDGKLIDRGIRNRTCRRPGGPSPDGTKGRQRATARQNASRPAATLTIYSRGVDYHV
ncbi:MAG: hypothetical protein H6R15_4032 [Proteobacteria bacterium]|nr:hypothetical protein [Pseudomonadota bacterium]